MFNKALFEKICNVSCSPEELNGFITGIDTKEFDSDKPFEKYYRVGTLLSAIEKYQAKEIDADFLACWMVAYNWIIMGGFRIEESNKNFSLREFLIWELSDWIDGLSFFEDEDDWYDLNEYKTTFKVLDCVLRDIDKCKAVFAQHGYKDDDVVVLITNEGSKYFIKVYGELDFNNLNIGFEKIEFSDLQQKAQSLLDSNYTELIYCTLDDEE